MQAIKKDLLTDNPDFVLEELEQEARSLLILKGLIVFSEEDEDEEYKQDE